MFYAQDLNLCTLEELRENDNYFILSENDKLEESIGPGIRFTLNNFGYFLCVSGAREAWLCFTRIGPGHTCWDSNFNSYKNDNGDMEKKITKKFYLISALNIIPAVILGWGNVLDILVLILILGALVFNHSALVNMVTELSRAMTSEGAAAKKAQKRMVLFLILKMTVLAGMLAIAYFYSPALLPKVMLMMIFQLIIQVISIKNNY